MQGSGRNRTALGASGAWPRITDRDAALLRLDICRHLLVQISDEPFGDPDEFGEVGRFLSGWTEARVQMEPRQFCTETVRILGLILANLERDRSPSREPGVAPVPGVG